PANVKVSSARCMTPRRLPLLVVSLVTLALARTGAAEPTGKRSADASATSPRGKTLGKPLARVVAGDHPAARPRPLTLAQPGKAAAPAPFVRTALTELAARSEAPAQLRLDPARGTLRRFDGRVPNPRGPGLPAARAMLAEH